MNNRPGHRIGWQNARAEMAVPPPNACTSETQKLLEVLAATLRSLSDEDRARLAELIQRED